MRACVPRERVHARVSSTDYCVKCVHASIAYGVHCTCLVISCVTASACVRVRATCVRVRRVRVGRRRSTTKAM